MEELKDPSILNLLILQLYRSYTMNISKLGFTLLFSLMSIYTALTAETNFVAYAAAFLYIASIAYSGSLIFRVMSFIHGEEKVRHYTSWMIKILVATVVTCALLECWL